MAVSFLEIHGARCADLLHGGAKVAILEDARARVVCSGLAEVECASPEALLALVARGSAERATHATEVNAQSSRSHAICEVVIRARGETVPWGSIALVDLAGSERAADSRAHNQQRRVESAEINKSLLALKECIRALAMRATTAADVHVHVPFRASKLTLRLRDAFTAAEARVAMIATVSPNAASADHSNNTLRYADRVKEKAAGDDDDVEAAELLLAAEAAGGVAGAGSAGAGAGLGADFSAAGTRRQLASAAARRGGLASPPCAGPAPALARARGCTP